MARLMKSQVIALFAGLFFIASGLVGCGGSSSSGSQTFETSKSLGQTVMMIVLSFAPTLPPQTTQSAKASQSCANGGSMSVNPDGSITFYNCSFFEGYLFNGTIRIIPQSGDTQGGRIEFDNFSGTLGDDTGFEMDGYIQETETADGSLDFDVDLDTTTTYMGEPDIFNIDGDFSIGDDGRMTGSMFIDNGDSDRQNTLCDFEGVDITQFQTEGGGGALMDSACRELDTPFS